LLSPALSSPAGSDEQGCIQRILTHFVSDAIRERRRVPIIKSLTHPD
jgi:hypothetical protein